MAKTVTKGNPQNADDMDRITFDAPAALKASFKAKVAIDRTNIKDVFCYWMQAYVDGKLKAKEN